jgi:hypothetical protein
VFYTAPMERERALAHLQEQLWAQVKFGAECLERGRAAGDWRLRCAWIDVFLRLNDAVIQAGFVCGKLENGVSPDPLISFLLANLRLPKLPVFPNAGTLGGGTPPPPEIRKTTSGHFSNEISGLRGKIAKPRLRTKAKGGAPKGNRNARTSGAHTAEFREFRRAVSLYVKLVRAQLAPSRRPAPIEAPHLLQYRPAGALLCAHAPRFAAFVIIRGLRP